MLSSMQTKQLIYSRFLTDLIWSGLWICTVQDCTQEFLTRMSLVERPAGMDYSTHAMLKLCLTMTNYKNIAITFQPCRARPGGLATASGCRMFIWTAKDFRYQPTVRKICLAMSCRRYVFVSQSLMTHHCTCHQTHRTICPIPRFHCQSPLRDT